LLERVQETVAADPDGGALFDGSRRQNQSGMPETAFTAPQLLEADPQDDAGIVTALRGIIDSHPETFLIPAERFKRHVMLRRPGVEGSPDKLVIGFQQYAGAYPVAYGNVWFTLEARAGRLAIVSLAGTVHPDAPTSTEDVPFDAQSMYSSARETWEAFGIDLPAEGERYFGIQPFWKGYLQTAVGSRLVGLYKVRYKPIRVAVDPVTLEAFAYVERPAPAQTQGQPAVTAHGALREGTRYGSLDLGPTLAERLAEDQYDTIEELIAAGDFTTLRRIISEFPESDLHRQLTLHLSRKGGPEREELLAELLKQGLADKEFIKVVMTYEWFGHRGDWFMRLIWTAPHWMLPDIAKTLSKPHWADHPELVMALKARLEERTSGAGTPVD
jgi:hypothetical protein